VEIFVARDELANRLSRKQDLCRVKGPALVDLDQPALQDGSLHCGFALGAGHVGGRRLHLVGNRYELVVERRHHSGGGIVLLVEQIHLVGELVRGVLEPAHLLFELVALGADAGKLVPLRPNAGLGVRLLGR
jgi:hypothetical protein